MNWDYKLEDPIDFFDRSQSYELTGYRPIDDVNGLDFNPDWFREAAIRKVKTGNYSGHPIGSPGYIDFWKEEKNRCINGYSVNGYRLTGDNYFFLNYYNLKDSDVNTINQDFGFPSFFVFQYEWFHYLELAFKLGKDVSMLKSRGIDKLVPVYSNIDEKNSAKSVKTKIIKLN